MSLQSDVIVVDPTVGELMVSAELDTDMTAMTTGVVSVTAVYSVPVRSIVPERSDSAAATATQGCPPQSRLGGVPDAEAGGRSRDEETCAKHDNEKRPNVSHFRACHPLLLTFDFHRHIAPT